MKNYIEQLLSDMKKAEQNLPPRPNYKVLYPDHPAHDYGLEHIVAWECTPEQPFQELYEIAPEAFPPVDKLTDEQVKSVVDAIISLWAAYGTGVDIPEKATPRLCYKVFTKAWREEKVQYFPPDSGFCSWNFCSSDEETCPWESACSCFENKEEWQRNYEDFNRRFDAGEFDNPPASPPNSKNDNQKNFDYDNDELPF
jgi:hypothetical protein